MYDISEFDYWCHECDKDIDACRCEELDDEPLTLKKIATIKPRMPSVPHVERCGCFACSKDRIVEGYRKLAETYDEDIKTERVLSIDPTTGGAKGVKSERHDLIPMGPLKEVAERYGLGIKEGYGERNWELGYKWSLSYAALQRHLTAFWQGEDEDPGTGSSHLAAVVFHAFALMEFQKTHPELDDRVKTS